jgi:hypothetical protein
MADVYTKMFASDNMTGDEDVRFHINVCEIMLRSKYFLFHNVGTTGHTPIVRGVYF